MANEFVARNGIIALNNSTITGSLLVSGSFQLIGPITGPSASSTTTGLLTSTDWNIFNTRTSEPVVAAVNLFNYYNFI